LPHRRVHEPIGVFVFRFGLGLSIIAGGGCRDSTKNASSPSAPGDVGDKMDSPISGEVPETPMDTARLLRRLRTTGRLAQLRPYLTPEHCEAILDLILAVDQLTIAAAELQSAVGDTIGEATADLYDFTSVANSLELFSRDVELVDEQVRGEEASVVIQVASRVPLNTVRFNRINGRWILQTDAPRAGLPEGVLELAAALRRCAVEQRRNRWTIERFNKELDRRTQDPRTMLRQLKSQAGSGDENSAPR